MEKHFDFLAQARPASLNKLMERLSMGDAAIVLSGLPQKLVLQTMAYFPDDKQVAMLQAMREARFVSNKLREETAQKIRGMLDAAKAAKGPTPKGPPVDPDGKSFAERLTSFGVDAGASILTGSVPEPFDDDRPAPAIPITPKFVPPKTTAQNRAQPPTQPSPQSQTPPAEPTAQRQPPVGPASAAFQASPQARPGPSARPVLPPKNPYAPTLDVKEGVPARPAGPAGPVGSARPAEPKQPAAGRTDDRVDGDERQPNSGELIGQAISDLGAKIKKAFTPPDSREKGRSDDGFRKKDPAAGRSPAPDARKKPEPRPADFGKPVPWTPRAATSSPINGPALPGKPPVSGDPFESPLARAEFLLGWAQEKFMPKSAKPPADRPPPPSRKVPPTRPAAPASKGGRPEPREGVVDFGKVEYNATPRVIGPRPKAEEMLGDEALPAPGARRMDGKAILAAILRNAPREVRRAVRRDDPKLLRELEGRMFYFDDLIYTEDSALARVFTAAPADTAALALKFAAPALRDRVLAAVSPGRAKALMDTPRRAGLDAIEAAQNQVLSVALKLQAAGRILIDPRDPDLAE